jgi:hypothetical protein
MQQGNLNVTIPQVTVLIDEQVDTFYLQPLDAITFREIEIALNANIEKAFAYGFTVTANPAQAADGIVMIEYTHQGTQHTYRCEAKSLKLRAEEVLRAKINLAAAAVEAALEALKSSPSDGRLINVGRTQIQSGFMALRRSIEPNPEAI